MKNGLLIYNNYWSAKSLDYCTNSLINSAIKYDVDIEPVSGKDFIFNINPDNLNNIDFVIMRDKFPNLAKAIEYRGIRVFNSSECIRICDDKAEMCLTLSGNNLPRPYTIISPETYGKEIGAEFIQGIIGKITFPIIIKKVKSSHGMGVFMAKTEEELMKYAVSKESLVFEQFIPLPFGKDYRVFVVGDKVIGAIERSGKDGDFRSNIELGGSGRAIKITPDIEKLALSAIKAVGADYGGVDIINAEKPVVIEVNACPGFKCMDEINNINTSSYLIKYILETIK